MKQTTGLSQLSFPPLLTKEVKKKSFISPCLPRNHVCFHLQFACGFLLGKGLKEKNHSALTRKTISGVCENCLEKAGEGGTERLQTEMFQGRDTGSEVPVWMLVDGKCVTGPGCSRTSGTVVSGLCCGSVRGSWKFHKQHKNRCSKLSATEALPVRAPLSINACAFLYMFLMNSHSLW